MTNTTAFLSTTVTTKQTATGFTTTNNPQEISFPFNPNDLHWSYTLNKTTFDTYGGRVTQILSVKIESLTVQADAGSRANLMALFTALKQMQTNQIETRQTIKFYVPSTQPDIPNSSLSFDVWFRSIDIGWDPTTVVYPFSIQFEIQDDSYSQKGYNGLSDQLTNSAIKDMFTKNVSVGVGYGTLSQYYAGLAPMSQYTGLSAVPIATNNQLYQNSGLGSNPAATSGK